MNRDNSRQRLVLFDIDGTLLSCGRQVGGLFLETLEEVFGTCGNHHRFSFAGKTDPQIVFDLMTDAGFASHQVLELLPTMRDRYLPRLKSELDPSKMKLFGGVRCLLDDLHRRTDVCLGLVTGNWERGARSKLDRFDLNGFFAFGAFGDDGIDRNELPPVAVRRARECTGRSFPAQDVLIVGDTPADVECARAHDHPVLAVATGHWSVSELEAAGADWVVPDLECEKARSLLLAGGLSSSTLPAR